MQKVMQITLLVLKKLKEQQDSWPDLTQFTLFLPQLSQKEELKPYSFPKQKKKKLQKQTPCQRVEWEH